MNRIDEAHEGNAAQIEEEVEALIDFRGDLVGEDFGDGHRDSHND